MLIKGERSVTGNYVHAIAKQVRGMAFFGTFWGPKITKLADES